MNDRPLSLPVDDWPEGDRERWRLAQEPAGFLEDDKPASRWSRSRRRIVVRSYGQWLAFLDHHDALDPSCAPGERVSEERLRAFILELADRVAPASVSMMVGALLCMLAVLEPGHDWTWLRHAYNHLKRTAVPSRDKLACMVPATELFALGIRLMDTCDDGGLTRRYKATRYRDGLLIALLIACPMRIKNLSGLAVGNHLTFDGHGYLIELSAAETKTGRPYVAAVPIELTPYVDHYLEVHRPRLQTVAIGGGQADSTGRHLWLDCSGRPMSSKAIRDQIETRTRDAFGRPIWPHLFRDCAVTELVDGAPDEIGIAPDLLGHSNLQTTRRHYIQAQGMRAHAHVQNMIVRRRAAVSREVPELLQARRLMRKDKQDGGDTRGGVRRTSGKIGPR